MGPSGDNPLDDKTNSVAELRKQVLFSLEQKLTGLVKIVFVTGEELTLVTAQGEVRQAYYKNGAISKVLPNFWLSRQFLDKQATLSICPLTARRLLFEKVILESDGLMQENRLGFKTTGLAQLFASLAGRESGSLVQIQWKSAEAFVLIPGSKIGLRPALFSSGGTVEEETHALGLIESWKDAVCDLNIYCGGIETEAWIEAHLVVLFESLCNYLLIQYGYMTGRVMVTAIVQNLMILAAQKGWEVNRLGNVVVDQTVFTSPQEAASAYRELLEMVLVHMGAVIGSRLARSIIQQGIGSYNTFYLNLIKTYELI